MASTDEKRAAAERLTIETLREAASKGFGWTGNTGDVAVLWGLIERGDAERARMATRIAELERYVAWSSAPVSIGGAASAASDVATALHVEAAERFPDCPPWVGVLLEEFRQEWVERGRDAARRATAWAMRQCHVEPFAGAGMPPVRSANRADLARALEDARLHLDSQKLATRPPEGLTLEEVLGALRQGFDDEALYAATAAGRDA